MDRSTFSFWLLSLVMMVTVAFICGYASPCVTKESKRAAKEYLKGGPGRPKPRIVITTRFNSETVICLALGLTLATMMFYFAERFPALVEKLGGNDLAAVLGILVLLLMFTVMYGGVVFIYLLGATVSSGYLEKFYIEYYGADIVYDLDEPERKS